LEIRSRSIRFDELRASLEAYEECKVIRVKSNEARRGMQTGGEGKCSATWEKLRPD